LSFFFLGGGVMLVDNGLILSRSAEERKFKGHHI